MSVSGRIPDPLSRGAEGRELTRVGHKDHLRRSEIQYLVIWIKVSASLSCETCKFSLSFPREH
jgi:hypothetical protein